MTDIEILRNSADLAFGELMQVIEGLDEPHSWAALKPAEDDYLHTDGSVLSMILHIATGKRIYGSVGFRNSEVRWRDLADQVSEIEPSLAKSIDYLKASHNYWIESWADFADFEQEVPHFRGRMVPAWKIVETVIQHDCYHAGQIAIVRYATASSSVPPPSTAEDIRKHCAELPSW